MRKLYGEFTKDDWLRVSGMTVDEVPDAIILHGEDGNVAENIAEWEPAFDSILNRPRWNMVVGNKGQKKIGFVNVIWAPMTALIVHKFALMGTKRFIQIGYCGGLVPELKYGEVLVVAEALSEDGVTSQYFPKQNRFQSTKSLIEKSVDSLNRRSIPFQVGKVVSTSAMFLETNDLVKSWAANDLVGVDGETSTTLAIASKFGAESISLLTCSDNLSLGHNLYEQAELTEKSQDAAFEQIQNLAFELAIAD